MGHITNGGGRLLLFLLAARFFPADQAGLFFWALAVVTPVVYFLNLELRLSYVTDIHDRNTPGDSLALRITGNIAACAFIVPFAIYIARYDNTLAALLLILCSLTRMTECFADSFIGIMQKKEKMHHAALSYILRTTIIIFLTVIAGLHNWPIWSIPIIWTGTIVVVNLYYERNISSKLADIKIRFKSSILRQLFSESLPLGTFMAIATLTSEAGKYFIKHYLSNAEVAYYSIAITIINGVMMTQNGINQGVLRRLSLYNSTDPDSFRKLLSLMLLISTGIMLSVITIFTLIGREILSWLIKPEYAVYLYDKGPVLLIMLAGGLLMIWAMVIGDAIVACREFTGRMTSMAASLVINVFLCYYLVAVKSMQLSGIAWAFTGSAVVNLAVNIFYLTRVRRKQSHER
ncbi:MAG: oligosaccharide flippase family protein [Sedimentisphaerales bacterium]|nr:oligosaccharide flippase family protein [Sedimentisphaerales bacterium]